jgi:UDP-glucose 4-epimerase
MRVLITGDKGFVGRATVRSLDGHIGYSHRDGFDICDLKQFREVVKREKPDAILHLAAIARYIDANDSPMTAIETNIFGTRNIVRVCAEKGIPLVYASTGSVYMPVTRPPPITEDFECKGNSVYGMTKCIGEEFVRQHSPHIVLRYSHLYGNEKGAIGLVGLFIDSIERGVPPIIYGGNQSNDFTYIKDVVQANLLALKAPKEAWNKTYNIGSGEEITTEQAARVICKLTGYTGKLDYREVRTVDAKRFVYSIEKARRLLGYEPRYCFYEGLKEMIMERKVR